MKAYTDYLSILNAIIEERKVTRDDLRAYDMSILKNLGIHCLCITGLVFFGIYGVILALIVAVFGLWTLLHAYNVRKVLVNNLEDAA